MDADLKLIVDRIDRSRAARDVREAGRLAPGNLGTARTGGALAIGARVFDLVTGQEGEVIYGTRENFVVPAPKRRDG